MRILVIDDNATFARAVQRVLLTSEVERVEIETNPITALDRIVAGEHFDLILCDIKMPELDGRQVRAAIADHFRGRKPPAVVLITGDEDRADPGDNVLAKPLRAGALHALVHAVRARADRPG